MGRAKIANETGVLSIRLPLALIQQLDVYAATLREKTPGVNITRTDAARAIITRGLAGLCSRTQRRGQVK